jgi:hypothetical protein
LKSGKNRKILNISDGDGEFPSPSAEHALLANGLALDGFEANQLFLFFSVVLDQLLGVSLADALRAEPFHHLFLNVLPINFHGSILTPAPDGGLLISAVANAAESANGGAL